MRYESMIDAIGDTPLVALRPGPGTRARMYAKLELLNPYGMKDRVARQMLRSARRSGELVPGAPIIESSSGTMALGLALAGAALGHPVHIVTDPRIDRLTLVKLRGMGCVVHVVERMSGHGWQSARLERLQQLRAELPGAFWPRQYSSLDNPLAYASLADELLADLDRVDVLVGAVGSGGSLCGTARALRERQPDLWVVAVDCVGSAIFGQPDRPERLQSGLGNSLVPDNVDRAAIDEVHWLNDREAFAATARLAAEQQIFAGNSAGSVYRVLRHLATTRPPESRLVGLLADRGDRYVDTVFDPAYWQEKRLSELGERTAPRRVAYGEPVSSWSCCVLADERELVR